MSAALTKSTDKLDPFAILEFTQNKRFKGPTHKGGHKTPKWDWECDYFYYSEGGASSDLMMKIAVWEEDSIIENGLVGESGPINVQQLCPHLGKQVQT